MTKLWNRIVATVLLTLCVPIVGQAQNIWGPPAETPEFRVEFQKPYFENNLLTGFTGVWFFSGAVPLGRRVIIVGDLPVTHTAIKDNERFGPGSFSQTDFGNPFIGLQLRNPTSPILAEFGLRLPLFSDATNISSAALFADFDRFGAFQPEFLAISAAINYVRQYKTGLGIRLRLSPEMLIDMDKHEEDNFTMALVR